LLNIINKVVLFVDQIIGELDIATMLPCIQASFLHEVVHLVKNLIPVFSGKFLSGGLEAHHIENLSQQFEVQSVAHVSSTFNIFIMLNTFLVNIEESFNGLASHSHSHLFDNEFSF
jgi:hypothetical protein